VKRLRYGIVLPGPHMVLRAIANALSRFWWGRAVVRRIRPPR